MTLPVDFLYLHPIHPLRLPGGVELMRFRFGRTHLIATQIRGTNDLDFEVARGFCPECDDTADVVQPAPARRGRAAGCWCCYKERLDALLGPEGVTS